MRECACLCVCVYAHGFVLCVCVGKRKREKGKRLGECYNEDYFPGHEKGLYQATTHRPRRTQALVAPVDLAQEITGVTRLGRGHGARSGGKKEPRTTGR